MNDWLRDPWYWVALTAFGLILGLSVVAVLR